IELEVSNYANDKHNDVTEIDLDNFMNIDDTASMNNDKMDMNAKHDLHVNNNLNHGPKVQNGCYAFLEDHPLYESHCVEFNCKSTIKFVRNFIGSSLRRSD